MAKILLNPKLNLNPVLSLSPSKPQARSSKRCKSYTPQALNPKAKPSTTRYTCSCSTVTNPKLNPLKPMVHGLAIGLGSPAPATKAFKQSCGGHMGPKLQPLKVSHLATQICWNISLKPSDSETQAQKTPNI